MTPDDFAKIISRKGDFLLLNGPENFSARKKRGPNKRRGRKNQYYTQIDAEDDQEAENMETETLGDVGGPTATQMGLIREVDEEKHALKDPLSSGKKKQVKISEDKAAIDKQKKKSEEDRLKREAAEEQARKKKEEQEAKKIEEEMLKGGDRQPTFGQETKEPRVQVPPEANKRTFNENDILGEFDRDEKGNIILLQD